MKTKVLSWVDRLDVRGDLHLLIPSYDTCVAIESEDEAIFIIMSKNHIDSVDSIEAKPELIVRGNNRSIQQLLAGSMLLQQLYKEKQIALEGAYRTILLFESLCWLNKP